MSEKVPGEAERESTSDFFHLEERALALFFFVFFCRRRFLAEITFAASRSFFGCHFFPSLPPATPVSDLLFFLRRLASSGELLLFLLLLATWEILERLVLEQRASDRAREREGERASVADVRRVGRAAHFSSASTLLLILVLLLDPGSLPFPLHGGERERQT